ncbi:hypothetical protein [Rudaea sp.]|uniref:hypothetical protein n=1 Tax=Rudaea sp. TaxID=2136325 RepID=UPI002ED27459
MIARLRRHLAAVMWLAVFVMLAKVSIATACLTDGPRAEPSSSTAVVVADASAAGSSADDDAAFACWHAAQGGCHCSCAHGSALPIADVGLVPMQFRGVVFSEAVPAPLLTAREPVLRPPIA